MRQGVLFADPHLRQTVESAQCVDEFRLENRRFLMGEVEAQIPAECFDFLDIRHSQHDAPSIMVTKRSKWPTQRKKVTVMYSLVKIRLGNLANKRLYCAKIADIFVIT